MLAGDKACAARLLIKLREPPAAKPVARSRNLKCPAAIFGRRHSLLSAHLTKMPSSTASIERTIARASVATPLALLVFVAATLIGSLVAKPSLAEISRDYLTILTPNENLIGIYWLVLGLLLLGGSFRIVLARGVESKVRHSAAFGPRGLRREADAGLCGRRSCSRTESVSVLLLPSDSCVVETGSRSKSVV